MSYQVVKLLIKYLGEGNTAVSYQVIKLLIK